MQLVLAGDAGSSSETAARIGGHGTVNEWASGISLDVEMRGEKEHG